MIDIQCADNLEFLRGLLSNHIDLIYCDVLFNTGRHFEDYQDSLGTPKQAQEWYYPRFVEMRRVLKNTGLLYIHCDSMLSHHIKIILDEIFGIEQFRNEIIWYYNSAPRGNKDFGKRHDVIFRYSKTENYFFNPDSKYIRQAYSETAPRGYAKEKYYDERGKILDDVWVIDMLGQNDQTERVGYSTQKPKALLYPILDSSCPKGGLVADFFLGSGTTAVVAKELKLNFIGCDINSKSIKIAKQRLRKSLVGLGNFPDSHIRPE